jgi:hypothetical protein
MVAMFVFLGIIADDQRKIQPLGEAYSVTSQKYPNIFPFVI